MPGEQHSLDERIAVLGERVERLGRLVPAPPRKPSPAPLPDPLGTAQVMLVLFVVAASLLLVQDTVAILATPDGRAFVSVEDRKFHVWRDVWAYEAATGKRWSEQPPGTVELVATYHDARRDQALSAGAVHLLFLALAALALRKVVQARRDTRRSRAMATVEQGAPVLDGGVAAELGATVDRAGWSG